MKKVMGEQVEKKVRGTKVLFTVKGNRGAATWDQKTHQWIESDMGSRFLEAIRKVFKLGELSRG